MSSRARRRALTLRRRVSDRVANLDGGSRGPAGDCQARAKLLLHALRNCSGNLEAKRHIPGVSGVERTQVCFGRVLVPVGLDSRVAGDEQRPCRADAAAATVRHAHVNAEPSTAPALARCQRRGMQDRRDDAHSHVGRRFARWCRGGPLIGRGRRGGGRRRGSGRGCPRTARGRRRDLDVARELRKRSAHGKPAHAGYDDRNQPSSVWGITRHVPSDACEKRRPHFSECAASDRSGSRARSPSSEHVLRLHCSSLLVPAPATMGAVVAAFIRRCSGRGAREAARRRYCAYLRPLLELLLSPRRQGFVPAGAVSRLGRLRKRP